MSYAIFTRLSDGAVLQVGENANPAHAPKSFVIDFPGLFGWARQRAYAGGNQGQSIPIGTAMAQRDFSIVIESTDQTGAEQAAIGAFFDDDGYFTVTHSDFAVDTASFTMVNLEPTYFQGRDLINMACRLQKGKMELTPYNNFQSYSLAAGAAGTQTVSRTVPGRRSIAISLETASATAYNPITLTIAGTVSGVTNTVQGVLASTNTYSKFFLDSSRGFTTMQSLPNSGSGSAPFIPLPLGVGVLSAGTVTFTVPKGATVSLSIAYTALPAAATLRVWELGL